MPRRNTRPQAKKWAARKKARMQAKAKPQRRLGIITHRHGDTMGILLAVISSGMARAISPTQPPR